MPPKSHTAHEIILYNLLSSGLVWLLLILPEKARYFLAIQHNMYDVNTWFFGLAGVIAWVLWAVLFLFFTFGGAINLSCTEESLADWTTKKKK